MSFNVDGLNHCELAHEIVNTTPCGYCGAKEGARCIAYSKPFSTYTQPDYQYRTVLSPSKSHRMRINAYWANQ